MRSTRLLPPMCSKYITHTHAHTHTRSKEPYILSQKRPTSPPKSPIFDLHSTVDALHINVATNVITYITFHAHTHTHTHTRSKEPYIPSQKRPTCPQKSPIIDLQHSTVDALHTIVAANVAIPHRRQRCHCKVKTQRVHVADVRHFAFGIVCIPSFV